LKQDEVNAWDAVMSAAVTTAAAVVGTGGSVASAVGTGRDALCVLRGTAVEANVAAAVLAGRVGANVSATSNNCAAAKSSRKSNPATRTAGAAASGGKIGMESATNNVVNKNSTLH